MAEGELLKPDEQEFERYYRYSSWWVNHRGTVRHILYALFIALDAALLCFAIWTFTDEFLLTYTAQQQQVAAMVADQADVHAQTAAQAAQPLTIGSVSVLADENSTVDLYAPITNPNADWWAEFDYSFQSGSTTTPVQQEFVLPGDQNKPLLALAVSGFTSSSGATLVISNLVWNRVDAHTIPDYKTWAAPRLGITVQTPAFNANIPFAGKTISQVTFTLVNNTAYGYYNPTFDVLLENGSSVVGVAQTTLNELDAGVTMPVTLDWFGPLPGASQVVVLPDINLFDPTIYIAPTGNPPVDIRDLQTP